MSQLFGLEQLEEAIAILTRAEGSLRYRLATTWSHHLVRIQPDKDLPADVRGRFRALPLFGQPPTAMPLALALLKADELRACAADLVDIRDRVRHRLGK